MGIYTKLPSLEISWCQHGWGCSEVKISFADVWQRSGPSTDVMALIERVEPRMVECFSITPGVVGRSTEMVDPHVTVGFNPKWSFMTWMIWGALILGNFIHLPSLPCLIPEG
jgi:hypothetical protein